MPHNTLAADAVEGVGLFSLLATTYLTALKWLNLANVNDLIVTFTAAVGFVWVCWKVVLIKKQSKIADLDLEIKKEDLKHKKEENGKG